MNKLPATSNATSGFDRIQGIVTVKHAIREFLLPNNLAASSGTSHFFNTMMGDQGTWKKIASKLQITPQNPGTAKKEVFTHLKALKCAIQIFPETKRPALSTIKDPFDLHNKISAELKLLRNNCIDISWNFHNFLSYLNSKIGTLEGLDQSMLAAAVMIIKQGIMRSADRKGFEMIFQMIRGRCDPREIVRNKIYYCPEHLILFQLLLGELQNSKLSPSEKQRVMEVAARDLYVWDLPRALYYPTNFIAVALDAGMPPTVSLMWRAIDRCPTDLWGNKVGSPIVQLLNRATIAERNLFLSEVSEWEDNLHENIEEILHKLKEECLGGDTPDLDFFKERSKILAHSYVNWSELVCLVGNEDYVADQKDRQSRADWILVCIEGEERETLSKIGNNEALAKVLREAYGSFRTHVQTALK